MLPCHRHSYTLLPKCKISNIASKHQPNHHSLINKYICVIARRENGQNPNLIKQCFHDSSFISQIQLSALSLIIQHTNHKSDIRNHFLRSVAHSKSGVQVSIESSGNHMTISIPSRGKQTKL
ncbi:hypothetical protein Droror1_Dr00024023 [Drosera rotundifolia]